MSGSRNLKMAKLEDARNVGISVGHTGIFKKKRVFFKLLHYNLHIQLINS